jgi:non-specific serine/threonine protein kinase
VQLLGRFQVWRGESVLQPRDWIDRKVPALFKLLVSERGRVYSQDELLELLWPEMSPEQGIKNLRVRVSQLRNLLGPKRKHGKNSGYILTTKEGYCFNAQAACGLDTEAMRQHVQAAQASEAAGRWPEALENYQQAVTLYRGDYLAEDPYEEWTLVPRERWRELYLLALSHLAECEARLGQYSRAIQHCRRLLELAPCRESFSRQKMLYHHLIGERSEALQTYHACVQRLKDELEVEPSPETRELHRQILEDRVVKAGYPPLTGPARHNLPALLTSFIGRKQEISAIKQMLKKTRLLTLTGVGGCGKTRLALQVAAQLLDQYPEGIWLVELAALSEPMLVAQATAAPLGLREEPQRPLLTTLTDYLKAKKLLLILDNCEHLLAACVELVGALLRNCPHLQILATSREGLGIAGERSWPVGFLSLPDLQRLPSLACLKKYEAIQLFSERATAALPNFQMTHQNAPAVAQICHQLDGMPLAIELAATLTKALSAEQIAQRLSDRFRPVTDDHRTDLPHQQTLRATFDWSYDLLLKQEQMLFRCLSVFAGGFSLQAAEAVCVGEGIEGAEVTKLLVRLTGKSLVTVEAKDGETRYRILETLRQYGHDKLKESGETDYWRRRHLDFFLKLVEEAEPELLGSEQGAWLRRLEPDRDNLRAALESSLKGNNADAALRMAGALWLFWYMRGYWSEGREILDQALATSLESSAEARARALTGAGVLTWQQGDPRKAATLLEESIALWRQAGHQQGLAFSLAALGVMIGAQGERQRASELCEEGLALFRESGDHPGIAFALHNLGLVAKDHGSYERAAALLKESLALFRTLRIQWGIADSLLELGVLRRRQGDSERSAKLLAESLARFQELGEQRGTAYSLEGLAGVAYATKQRERAARLWGAAEALRETTKPPLAPADHDEYDLEVSAVRVGLGKGAFAAAWAQGRAMALEQAIAYALEGSSSSSSDLGKE